MYILLYVILAILALFMILALLAPKTYHVSRTALVNAPPETVFPYLQFLEKQDQWSPWSKKDPKMKKGLRGVDGQVGAISYWKGNKDVGEGEQEITKIVQGNRVEGQLRFLKPWKSESDCYMDLKSVEGGTSMVTWGFTGSNKFPFSIMMLFVSMDKMVGKDFEKGLEMLKNLVEKE